MRTIKLLGHVDELHRLSVQVPPEVPPGPVRLAIVYSSSPASPTDEKAVDLEWMMGISREWSAELSDPREDIYSLADGEPVDASR